MFSVDLHIRKFGDNVIISLSGELDMVDAADVAAELVAAAAGLRSIIVDLAGLTFIDCRGAAALVRAQHRVQRAGGSLLLAAPQSRVRRVFELSRLIDGVCLHPSVAQAGSQGPGETIRSR